MPRPLPPATNREFTTTPPDGITVRAHALAIHGYTGTPWEVLPVSLALADIGVTSTGIVLPGHEGDPRVLDRISWRDWVDSAERAWAQLPPRGPRVLVGSSMGALVALMLAARHAHQVSALVLMAPALRFFADGAAAAFASARGAWRLKRAIIKEVEGGDIRDDGARAMVLSYRELPLRGIGELGLLQREVEREALHKVTAPTCILHGAQDHTIPLRASELVARKLRASPRVERHVLRDSFHVIGVDVDRDQVCTIASSFVDEILA